MGMVSQARESQVEAEGWRGNRGEAGHWSKLPQAEVYIHEGGQFNVKISPTESLLSQLVNGNTYHQFPH